MPKSNIMESMSIHYDLEKARLPITIMHVIVYIGVIFIQYIEGFSWVQLVSVFVLVVIYSTIHWYSSLLLPKFKAFYFYILCFIILACAFIVPEASPIIMIGLMPIVMIQGAFYFDKLYQLIGLVLVYLTFYIYLMYAQFGVQFLWLFIVSFVVIVLFMYMIIYLFNQKEEEMLALHVANRKIKELTLQNERQRMARDLHDTLAQRLVGLILKIEVSEVHVSKGNVDEAEKILHAARVQAKESLEDIRQVIDGLRAQDLTKNFREKMSEELAQLQYLYHLTIDAHIDNIYVTPQQEAHLLAIVKEAITNVYKHADATVVRIKLTESTKDIQLMIEDNGTGMKETSEFGHYGLLGMQERAEIMQADLQITSKNGVIITLTIPKSEDD
ncbi:sensor histidine kinase [Solibacillus sp.]|uniref:sensor histidine kinase n=1 Tax=Solibacillus sp. TaxID=1909654 RepID=UPI003314E0C1